MDLHHERKNGVPAYSSNSRRKKNPNRKMMMKGSVIVKRTAIDSIRDDVEVEFVHGVALATATETEAFNT